MQDEVARYRKQLTKNPARGRVLRLVEDALEQAGHDGILAEILAERLQALEASGARGDLIKSVGQQRFEALMRHATQGEESLEAAQAALQAAQFAQQRGNEGAVQDAAIWALARGASDPTLREAAIALCGGLENARGLAKQALKQVTFKQRKGALRHALSLLAEQAGETDSAFFEALRAARTTPPMRRYLDEAFRLALMTGRFEEVALVFQDAVVDPDLNTERRSYLRLKLAHLLDKNLNRSEDALTVYTQLLSEDPSHEKAQARATQLAKKLGVDFVLPRPAADQRAADSADDDAPETATVVPESSQLESADPDLGDDPADIDHDDDDDAVDATPGDHASIQNNAQDEKSDGPEREQEAQGLLATEVQELHDLDPKALREVAEIPPPREGTDVFSAYDESLVNTDPQARAHPRDFSPAKGDKEQPPLAPVEREAREVFSAAEDSDVHAISQEVQVAPSLLAKAAAEDAARENAGLSAIVTEPNAVKNDPSAAVVPAPIELDGNAQQLGSRPAEDEENTDNPAQFATAEDDDDADYADLNDDDVIEEEELDEEVRENAQDPVQDRTDPRREDAHSYDSMLPPPVAQDLANADHVGDEPDEEGEFDRQETAPHPSLLTMQRDADLAAAAFQKGQDPIDALDDASEDQVEEDDDDDFAAAEIGTGQIIESQDVDEIEAPHTIPEDFDPRSLEERSDFTALAEGLAARLPNKPTLSEFLRVADLYESKLGLPAQAFPFYARALGMDEDDGAVSGVLRCAPGAPEAAQELYKKLSQAPEPRRELVLGLTRIIAANALDAGKPRQAIDVLEPVFQKNTDDAGLFRQLDRLYRETEQPKKRADLRARANFGDASTRLGMLKDRVDLLEEAGDMRGAILVARSVRAAQPKDIEWAKRFVQLAEKTGASAQVREALLALLDLVGDDEAVALGRRLAELAHEAQDPNAEREAWQRVLALSPNNAEALRALSELLESDAKLGPDLLKVLLQRLAQARSQQDEAQELLLLHRLADAKQRQDDPSAEEDFLRQALQVDPDDEDALHRVAEAARARNDLKSLAELYEDLAGRRTKDADQVAMWLAAAQLYADDQLDKKNKARHAFQEALGLDPNNGAALGGLADLYLVLGDPEAAVVHLERATRDDDGPDLADNLCRLGKIYEAHLMRGKAAVKAYQRALAVKPGHQEAGEALSQLYHHAEEWSDLLALLQQRAKGPDKQQNADRLIQAAEVAAEKLNDHGQALTLVQRALELDKQNQSGRELLVDLHLHEDNPEQALPTLEILHKALGVDAMQIDHLVALAQLQLSQHGEHGVDQAKLLLHAARKRSPAHLGVLRALGETLLSDGDADPEEIIAVFEQRILHHGPVLDAGEAAAVHGRIGILRRGLGDNEGARKSLQRALKLMPQDQLDVDVLTAHAELLVDEGQSEAAYAEIVRLAEHLEDRREPLQAGARWLQAGRLAEKQLSDPQRAVDAYQNASRLDPSRLDAIEAQLRVQVALGHSQGALQAAEALLKKEQDPLRLSKLEVAVATLCRNDLHDDKRATLLLRQAIEHDPNNAQALRAAELLFSELGEHQALEQVLSAAIKHIPRDQTEARVQALERLAQLRRYALEDLPGAVQVLEQILTLDESNSKAREDLARLYDQLGEMDRSVGTWRQILRRDALVSEAYRAMLTQFRRHQHWDAAYSVVATMSALELADNDVRAMGKRLRPPFPNWPKVPSDASKVQAALIHPNARGPVADLLRLAAPAVWSEFARPLKDFGLRRRDLLSTSELPASLGLAIRQAARVLDLPEPQIYRGGEDSFGISLLPIDPPALLIGADVLRGGMTPERAFAFGRAMAYLQPTRLLAASLSTPELRGVCEAILLRSMPKVEHDAQSRDLAKTGLLIEKRLNDKDRQRILALGREYYQLRNSYSMQDLVSATAFGADRVGFLFAGELQPSVAAIKAAAGETHKNSARLAIKELVNFSVSADYMSLRMALGLSLRDDEAAPVLSLT